MDADYVGWFLTNRNEFISDAQKKKLFMAQNVEGVNVRAEFWGLVIDLDNNIAKDTASIIASIATICEAVGAVFPPAVAPLTLYLGAEAILIAAVNKGNGVYLTMIWITPGIFVPTSR